MKSQIIFIITIFFIICSITAKTPEERAKEILD